MKLAVALAVLVCATGIAAAQDVSRPKAEHPSIRPQPIVIPQELSPPQEVYAAFPESSAAAAAAAAAPAAPSACALRLAKLAAFRSLPVLIGAGECGAVDAVQLDVVILSDQTKIPLAPPATLRCPMAEQVAHWIRDDVAPAAKELGAALREIDNFDSYECRGRNRVRGATLSEHGRANALDVRGFKLADGKSVGLTDVNVAKDWREKIKASACALFSTVLGPGSDGYHEEHIHLDLAERRNNYKVCEWDVREPPAQALDVTPPAESESPETEEVAPIPADLVPLPRPRPHKLKNAAADASSRSNQSGGN